MVAVSIRYEYSQHFRVPAKEAFAWCTDYSPDDYVLMGHKGSRKFMRVSEDTILLDDKVYPAGRAVNKRKLVRIDPKRLTYYNIHLTGPNKHSLYFYQIVPDGDGESRLDFTGYEVSYPSKAPSKKQLAKMAEAESAAGPKDWAKLAKAMERELRAKRS